MDKVQAIMHYQIYGIQIWIYLALGVVPFVLNEIVQRSKSTVAMSLFQFVMRIILQIPAIGAILSSIPGLGAALHKLAGDSTGLPPTYAQRRAARLNKIATKKAEEDPTPPVSPAALVLFFTGLTLLSGCGFCAVAANKDTARCKAESVVTNCAAPEVAKIVTDIAAQVASALANNDYSKLLDGIVADLISRGRIDGLGILTCAIQQVKAKPTATAMLSVVMSNGNAYMAAHPAKVK